MTRWAKFALVSVAVVMVTSIAGQPTLGGLLAAIGLLVAILLFLVDGARPGTRHRPRRARTFSQLGRYRPPDAPRSVPGVAVAAAAAWAVVELVDMRSPSALAVSLFAFAVVYVMAAPIAAPAVGVAGTAASVLGLVFADACGGSPSRRSYAVIGVAAVVAAVAFATVRLGVLPFGSPLARRRTAGTWALLLFGAVDVALFALTPYGVEIWDGAPAWGVGGLVLLFVVIALLAAFAVELILALLAVAVTFGQAVLALAEEGVVGGPTAPCGRPMAGLVWLVACTAIASSGMRMLSAGRSRWPTDVHARR